MLGLIVWIAEPDSMRVGLVNMSVGPDSMSSGQDSVFFSSPNRHLPNDQSTDGREGS